MPVNVTPNGIEELARDALRPFRKKGVIASVKECGVDVRIVEGRARMEGTECFLTVQVALSGASSGATQEEVLFIGSMLEPPAKIAAYIEGWAQAVGAMIKHNADANNLLTLKPSDLCFPDVLKTKAKTSLAFAEKILKASDDWIAANDPAEQKVDDLRGTRPIAVNAELEAAIAAAPDDESNYLVYGDWLTERGDPRGELVACHARHADNEAAAIIAKHKRYFVGNLHIDPKTQDEGLVMLEWKLGFIDAARVRANHDHGQTWGRDALHALLMLPSAKFLTSLIIDSQLFGYDRKSRHALKPFIDAGRQSLLRRLRLGDEKTFVGYIGKLADITSLYPNLEELEPTSGDVDLEDNGLAFPKLRSCTIRSSSLSHENAKAIAHACASGVWPLLETLEVRFGGGLVGGNSGLEDIACMLDVDAKLPRLRDLRLRGVQYADALLVSIIESPLLPQLERLDISDGSLSAEGARTITSAQHKLAHLKELNVAGNRLPDNAVAGLMATGLPIVSGYQKGDSDRAYDDVDE